MSRADSVFKLLKSLYSCQFKGGFSRCSSQFGAEKTLAAWFSSFSAQQYKTRARKTKLNLKIDLDLGPALVRENTSSWDYRSAVQSGVLLTAKKEYCTTSSNSTKMSECEYVVGHDKINNFFYIELQEKKSPADAFQAKLEYAWVRHNLVDMYHTEVPKAFQGRGIAKVLAKAAFDYFCEEEIMMRPTCTYLQKFLLENPTSRYMYHVEKCYL